MTRTDTGRSRLEGHPCPGLQRRLHCNLLPVNFKAFHITRHDGNLQKDQNRHAYKEQVPTDTVSRQRTPSRSRTALRRCIQNRGLVELWLVVARWLCTI
jgi:hypothetical protein